ncbi:MAG: B12-binding domain-containing protein [Anaerolineae bacterium]|nr:B12-binding domain-containing protein [Anaerolineae bacterium]
MVIQFDEFKQALLSLNHAAANAVVQQLRATYGPARIIEDLVMPALENLGEGWESGEIALSQIYMTGRICEELVDALLPPGAAERRNQPKLALVTLEDYHLLGKRIVYANLRAGGFEVLDYGRLDVPALVERTRRDAIEVLLISTLMLPSALRVREVRAQLEDSVKIIVGGAPFRFDSYLWQEVGADAMGYSATDAVRLVGSLSGGAQ